MKHAVESELEEQRFSLVRILKDAGEWFKEIFSSEVTVSINDDKEYSKGDYKSMLREKGDKRSDIEQYAELLSKTLETENILTEVKRRRMDDVVINNKNNIVETKQQHISKNIEKEVEEIVEDLER